jgi:ribosome-associated translation inhibitor RaiA
MLINVNTDKTIEHHAGLNNHVQTVVNETLHHFGEQISRVEVHLSDNQRAKSEDGDNRCMMEARISGYQPIAVTAHAATLHQAISNCADKLKRAIDSDLGRLNDAKRSAQRTATLADADTATVNEA